MRNRRFSRPESPAKFADTSLVPTYEYLCDDCGHADEQVHRIGRQPRTRACTSCKSGRMQQQLTGGSGFNAGTRVEYPLRDFQLPPDPTTGKSRVVHSAKEHRELASRAGMEMNQGYERDLVADPSPTMG